MIRPIEGLSGWYQPRVTNKPAAPEVRATTSSVPSESRVKAAKFLEALRQHLISNPDQRSEAIEKQLDRIERALKVQPDGAKDALLVDLKA